MSHCHCESQTLVCSVDSVNSSVQKKADSLLNPAGHCYSGPTLLESLMTEELKTNFHSTDGTDDI